MENVYVTNVVKVKRRKAVFRLDYKTFTRHAKRVIKTLAMEKEILKGIKHFEDGSVAVTDGHRLHIVKGIHDRKDGAVITPTGKKLIGNYPEIKRLIPSYDPHYSSKLDVNEFIKAMEVIEVAGVGSDSEPYADIDGQSISFKSVEIKAKYEVSVNFEERFTSNASFWIDALKMFDAFSYEKVNFNFYGRVRPFTLESADRKVFALILPVRRY